MMRTQTRKQPVRRLRAHYLVRIFCAAFRRAACGLGQPLPSKQSLEGEDGTRHALAVADSSLAAHANFQNRFAAGPVFHDFYVAEFEPSGLVGTKSGIDHEQ